ncbi:Protein kinase-like (PK-like) [Glarea lozoyensis ATCC 20868]|uniref:Protein kinase-like (PK-like) n=1 Tax=Glarea lozoyensis (strain ATCC 20868 / MF5171) TaxID=1116229 RepID=S3CRC1_GLAL2|nr:Protein kinase-like (PK-like) [Glarea lozoyensis ATCC 20868]EPE28215.1 Protein kinase-like (PK-like) [Glarea lozoyensis ATCC 20868]
MNQIVEDAGSLDVFRWPSSSPPSPENLEHAARLCQGALGSTSVAVVATPYNHAGWSAQDCIKVSFPSENRSFIAKVPRLVDENSATACKNEAQRASWASQHQIGPAVIAIDDLSGAFAMEFLSGQTLSAQMMLQDHLKTCTIGLLRRIHDAPSQHYMQIYNAPAAVKRMLQAADKERLLDGDDGLLLESLITWTFQKVGCQPTFQTLVPCHNDFHSQNIMLDQQGTLWAIDFEDCDLGDPMWDLGYLTANMGLEPLDLAGIYGCNMEQKKRLEVFYYLAIGHCAVWSAIHGPLWTQHYRDCMLRLRRGWLRL